MHLAALKNTAKVAAIRLALWPFSGIRSRRTHLWLYKKIRPSTDVTAKCGPLRLLLNPFDMSSGYPLVSRGHYFDDKYGPDLAASLAELADICIDVGANVGFYSLRLSRKCSGPILSIEPDPRNHRYLSKNVELNSASNVRIIQACVSNFVGEITLYRSKIHPGRNSISMDNVRKNHDSIRVDVDTLDNLAPVDRDKTVLIKIDVEGAEPQVLAGAPGILTRDCVIFLEYWKRGILAAGGEPQQMISSLLEIGFLPFILNDSLRCTNETSAELLAEAPVDSILNLVFTRRDSVFFPRLKSHSEERAT